MWNTQISENKLPNSWSDRHAMYETPLTYGGKAPLELAFGRRPVDVITVENSTPSQLTAEFGQSDVLAQQTRRLAMEAYLKARQSEDLRRDIASSLHFSDGPFQVGDKIWYWKEDPSKIKSDGQ